jgi:predicted nucleic acid-binding protein
VSDLELVVNASPWILLGKVESHELLRVATPQISVPRAVLEEVRAGLMNSASPVPLNLPPWLAVTDDREVPLEIAAWDLGAGESQVLARVSERSGRIAVIDDLQARRCARILGLPVLGTLGVVLLAKREGVIPRARPLVERLLQVGIYLADDLIRAALAEVGE